MAKKGKRGFKFTVAELEHMLDVIDGIVPIGNPDWEKVWQEHSAAYPTMEQTPESLKCKFQELVRKKILLVTLTVLLMFARPSEFQGKLLLRPMGRQAV
jgi:hypothetical protein